MFAKNKKHIFRPEDILAILMIIPSLWVTSPSEYYYLFNGNLVLSKHMIALTLLFIFAILTALYENRIQRIIDTIKSGVKIPAVTIQDQGIYLWKRKFRILYVVRDYLPFLFCILAYHRLLNIIPHINNYNLDSFFMTAERMLVDNFRNITLNWIKDFPEIKDLLGISYKTYVLSVPILATYLYLLKQFKKFREFLFAIALSSVLSLIINIILPSAGLEAFVKGTTGPLNGSISLPAIYTTTVLFFSLTVNTTLTLSYLPIALLFFLADILSYSHYIFAILISAIVGLVSIPLAKLIVNLSETEEKF